MGYSEDYLNVKKEIERTKELISQLPQESLAFWKDGKYRKWLAVTDKGKKVISKKDRKCAEKLALKSYLERKRYSLEEKKGAYEILLSEESYEKELLKPDSPYSELLLPLLSPNQSDDLIKWQNENYEHNTQFPEDLTVRTQSGVKVRSKSEAMIANELFSHSIPFRYECVLRLDEKAYYPDFTIIRKSDRESLYWEHFGLIDDPSYRGKALTKIRYYVEHGLLPFINLIMTFETRQTPLDVMKVRHIIDDYLV